MPARLGASPPEKTSNGPRHGAGGSASKHTTPPKPGALYTAFLFGAGGARGAPASLEVSRPGDSDEQEADRVSTQIMRMALPGGAGGAAPDPGSSLNGARSGLGSGQPLDQATRAFFEPRFGRDFSGVRVHHDNAAAESARELHAQAYTLGHDVVFGSGAYRPETTAGKELLAHELTHVVQQSSAPPGVAPRLQRQPVPGGGSGGGAVDCGPHFKREFLGEINGERPEDHRGVPRMYYATIPESVKNPGIQVEPLVTGTQLEVGQKGGYGGLWRAVCFKTSKMPLQILWVLGEYILDLDARRAAEEARRQREEAERERREEDRRQQEESDRQRGEEEERREEERREEQRKREEEEKKQKDDEAEEKLEIVPREGWGARDPILGDPKRDYEKYEGKLEDILDSIVVHHSGNSNMHTMKEVQDHHMDKKEGADIKYHYGVGLDGTIYQGRPIDIKGAHVAGANTGKIGIVLLADLDEGVFDDDDELTPAMESSLLGLINFLKGKYPKIDFLGGHTEFAAAQGDERECPGNLPMGKMDGWRSSTGLKKP